MLFLMPLSLARPSKSRNKATFSSARVRRRITHDNDSVMGSGFGKPQEIFAIAGQENATSRMSEMKGSTVRRVPYRRDGRAFRRLVFLPLSRTTRYSTK